VRGHRIASGLQTFKVKRTGKYPKLAVDRSVHVSEDGKLFFDGDAMTNPTPTPVRSAADLTWVEAKVTALPQPHAGDDARGATPPATRESPGDEPDTDWCGWQVRVA
jgi:hypothetical protein